MGVALNAWTRLGARDRRAVILGVLTLLPALGFALVVQPYRRARAELRDRVAEQRGLLARELALVVAAHRLPGELKDAARALANLRPRFLPGRDPLSATAGLVSAVGDEARRHNVLLESIESRAAESAGARQLLRGPRPRGCRQGSLSPRPAAARGAIPPQQRCADRDP
jgi:hypothetical protein